LGERSGQVVLIDINFTSGIKSGNEGLYWPHKIKRHKDLLNEKENLNTLKTERFTEYNTDKSLTLPAENRNSLWQKKMETS
ncbi:hypothetical protein, partial [Bacteroides sp.]|uniref:hypothetical protein n=1 Tax=Bacteroides sp. TaxID=29523 RepID=UPI00284E5C40